jgi:hypothetical protein
MRLGVLPPHGAGLIEHPLKCDPRNPKQSSNTDRGNLSGTNGFVSGIAPNAELFSYLWHSHDFGCSETSAAANFCFGLYFDMESP